MDEIILFLNNIGFNWTAIESIAVFFSIIYVILASKEIIWCWAAGGIVALLYIYICLFTQLYAETALHIFYLCMSFYGYYNWKKNTNSLKITSWNIKKNTIVLACGSIITFFLGFYLTTYTNASIPITDSFTTIFSIIATYMVIQKVLENWLYWIIIDVVSVHIYLSKDLHLTALLFVAYTIIAVFGYFSWIKKIKTSV